MLAGIAAVMYVIGCSRHNLWLAMVEAKAERDSKVSRNRLLMLMMQYVVSLNCSSVHLLYDGVIAEGDRIGLWVVI